MHWAESQEIFTLVPAFAFMTPGKSFLLGVWDLTHIDCKSPFTAFSFIYTWGRNMKTTIWCYDCFPFLWQDRARTEVYNRCPAMTSAKSHEAVWPAEWTMNFYNLLRFKCLHYFYCKFLLNLLSMSHVCMYYTHVCMCRYTHLHLCGRANSWHWVLFSVTLVLVFDRKSHWTWSSPIGLNWLFAELSKSNSLHTQHCWHY